MFKSKKWAGSIFFLAMVFFLFSGCIPGGGGVSSSQLFMPEGNDVVGVATVTGGFTNTKEQMYWLARALQEGGVGALAITASDNMSVSGFISAHEEGVEMIKTSSEIGDRLGKIGIMGFSMGGGAVITLGNREDVDAVVAMAPFTPSVRSGYHAPTAIFTGTADTIAPASMGRNAYDQIPNNVPKLYASVPGASHLLWMTGSSKGSAADFIVAWAQYYLNGVDAAYDVFSTAPSDLTDYQFNPGDGTEPGPAPDPGPCN